MDRSNYRHFVHSDIVFDEVAEFRAKANEQPRTVFRPGYASLKENGRLQFGVAESVQSFEGTGPSYLMSPLIFTPNHRSEDGELCFKESERVPRYTLESEDGVQLRFRTDGDGNYFLMEPSSLGKVRKLVTELQAATQWQARFDTRFRDLRVALANIEDEVEDVTNERALLECSLEAAESKISDLEAKISAMEKGGRKGRDERVVIEEKVFCPMPSIQGKPFNGETYEVFLHPGDFVMVKFFGEDCDSPVEVLNCLIDPVQGRVSFYGQKYERAIHLRRLGWKIPGQLIGADIVKMRTKQLFDVGSVQGRAEVIFHEGAFENLNKSHTTVERFRCLLHERADRKDGPHADRLAKLTHLQYYQSRMFGPDSPVLPSHRGIGDCIDYRDQGARHLCKAIFDRMTAKRLSVGAQCEITMTRDLFSVVLGGVAKTFRVDNHSISRTFADDEVDALRKAIFQSWPGFPHKPAVAGGSGKGEGSSSAPPPDMFALIAPLTFQCFYTQPLTHVRVTFSYVLEKASPIAGGWEYTVLVGRAEDIDWERAVFGRIFPGRKVEHAFSDLVEDSGTLLDAPCRALKTRMYYRPLHRCMVMEWK